MKKFPPTHKNHQIHFIRKQKVFPHYILTKFSFLQCVNNLWHYCYTKLMFSASFTWFEIWLIFDCWLLIFRFLIFFPALSRWEIKIPTEFSFQLRIYKCRKHPQDYILQFKQVTNKSKKKKKKKLETKCNSSTRHLIPASAINGPISTSSYLLRLNLSGARCAIQKHSSKVEVRLREIISFYRLWWMKHSYAWRAARSYVIHSNTTSPSYPPLHIHTYTCIHTQR